MKLLKKLAALTLAAAMNASIIMTAAVSAEEMNFVDEPQMYEPVLPSSISLSDMVGDDFEELGSSEFEDLSAASYTSIYLSFIMRGYTAAQKSQIEAKVSEILSGIDSSWDTVRKLAYINDYLATHIAYDFTYSKYDIYNGLMNGSCVCSGYAACFWYLCYKLDINCRMIDSSALNHRWNIVELNGNWYHVDVTWNDPYRVVNGQKVDVAGQARHQYFLISDSLIRTSDYGHDATDWRFAVEGYAVEGIHSASGFCTSTAYDSAFWQGVNTPLVFSKDNYFIPKNTIDSTKGIYKVANNLSMTKLADFGTKTWKARNSDTGHYWDGPYSNVGYLDGRVYYNDPDTVYSIREDGTDKQAVYVLSDSDKTKYYIFDLRQNGNVLTITAAVNPHKLSLGVSYYDIVIKQKTAAQITSAPTGVISEYTGESVSLAVPGTASGGTLYYSLDGISYSSTVPTASAKGKYTVYYKAVGDSAHSDSAVFTVESAIGDAVPESIAWTSSSVITYKYSIQGYALSKNITADEITSSMVEIMDMSTITKYVSYTSDKVSASAQNYSVITYPQLRAIEILLEKECA